MDGIWDLGFGIWNFELNLEEFGDWREAKSGQAMVKPHSDWLRSDGFGWVGVI